MAGPLTGLALAVRLLEIEHEHAHTRQILGQLLRPTSDVVPQGGAAVFTVVAVCGPACARADCRVVRGKWTGEEMLLGRTIADGRRRAHPTT